MDMVTACAPVVGAGVDWLSSSCNSPRRMQKLLNWRDEQFARLRDEGNELRPLSAHGRTGHAVGGVSVLVGRDDVLVQLSGDRANESWRDVALEATNVSRVDLQTTVRTHPGERHLAERSYRSLERLSPRRGGRLAHSLLTTSHGAETLYVGQRVSDQFGRLYDKASESGLAHYADCWRYEVVYKRRYAAHAVQALLATPTAESLVNGVVHDWFHTRGIAPCFDATDTSVGAPPPRKLSDNERWLQWYRRAVRSGAARRFPDLSWRELVQVMVPRRPSRQDLEAWLSTFDDDDVTVAAS
jgi:hypothetical protein